MPAVADVHPSHCPAPAATPGAIRANPEAYAASAPPLPSPSPWGWLLAGVTGAAITAVAITRTIAPAIPGLGPLWRVGIDSLWALLASRDAKKADEAAQTAARLIADLAPALRAFRDLAPDTWQRTPSEFRDIAAIILAQSDRKV